MLPTKALAPLEVSSAIVRDPVEDRLPQLAQPRSPFSIQPLRDHPSRSTQMRSPYPRKTAISLLLRRVERDPVFHLQYEQFQLDLSLRDRK
jgi:hypothetical protein